MKSKNVLAIGTILLAAATLIFVVKLQEMYPSQPFDKLNDIGTLAAGILSFLISGIALLISLITYFSIDAVNNLSSMEGNVLCNENYNAEYLKLVDNYADCKNRKELEKNLYKQLNYNLRWKSKTCMQFTDCLQEIIDHLLWYAYVDNTSCTYRRHINTMIKTIDRRFKRFSSISNGNQYILKEHIKLIKNVLKYQENRSSSKAETNSTEEKCLILEIEKFLSTWKNKILFFRKKNSSKEFDLLNIRGNLFTNAVSKTIYYDYLGLEYRYRAIQVFKTQKGLNIKKDFEIFFLENLETLESFSYTDQEKNELKIYIDKAREAFLLAAESSQNDILWNGYISFNLARLDLLEVVRSEKPNSNWTPEAIENFKSNWDKSIQDAINARFTVLSLFSPDKADSYLGMQFKNELYYAKALHLIVQAYLVRDNKAEFNKIVKTAKTLRDQLPLLPELPKSENNSDDKNQPKAYDVFKVPRLYLDNIINYKKVES